MDGKWGKQVGRREKRESERVRRREQAVQSTVKYFREK